MRRSTTHVTVNNTSPVTTFTSTDILLILLSYLEYEILLFLQVPLHIVPIEVFAERTALEVTPVGTDGVWAFLKRRNLSE